MSLSVTTDVFCDGEGCLRWTDGVEGRTRSAAREAREQARRKGWVHRGGRDLCPTCAAQLRQTPAPHPPRADAGANRVINNDED